MISCENGALKRRFLLTQRFQKAVDKTGRLFYYPV